MGYMLKNRIRSFLAEHPRLVSALFALLILWAQFGTAIATGSGESGP
jgi:hypothetical protein